MAALNGTTTSSNITVAAREVDFVSTFARNWDKLRKIMGIARPVRKTPGTQLTSYEAKKKGALNGGETVPEGDEIPLTEFEVTPVSYGSIKVAKYRKAVTVEAVEKYGAVIAVQKTDEAFLTELQNVVMGKFYTLLKSGTLTDATNPSWQMALAKAKGAVLNKFSKMSRTVTEVVGFANIMDAYSYLGSKDITIQTMFGINYVQNFLGYNTLFLLDDDVLPSGTVIATPVDNIVNYYVDPSDSDFAQLGLDYRVDGETNLIGFHAEGNYARAQGESYALMGMVLWAEFIDGIAVYSVAPATASASASGTP